MNFHLLTLPGGLSGREKYKKLSADLKHICTSNACTIFTTAEYRKLAPGARPNNSDLAETVALEYDSNAIMHCHSELHSNRDSTFRYHWNAEGEKSPLVEVDFGKNKVSSYKGRIHYKFYPEKATYIELTETEVERLEELNMSSVGGSIEYEDSE